MERLTVGIDTNIFIYFIEGCEEPYASESSNVIELIIKGNFNSIFSTLSLTEFLVFPLKENDKELYNSYLSFFGNFPNSKIVSLDEEIAIEAAKLRAKYNIRTPDSIHLATSITNQVNVFITNDLNLKKVKEISVLSPKEFVKKYSV